MSRKAWGTALVAGLLTVPLTVCAPHAAAVNGDTHIVGQGINQTIDCGGGTLFVNGSGNTITAFGNCWAVTVQGSSNTVIADTIVNDVTAYGFNQTVLFHNGDPALIDIGHQLGLANRLNKIP
ncbi:DUF3060 domain-containing protein [Mycolicibacterium sp. CBMA 311]|uniref:DUF3060 domain-containing protein n=1 Tax=unclassified Mycolicibacterium TaxID=2636767 RepID=UPI0035CD2CBC